MLVLAMLGAGSGAVVASEEEDLTYYTSKNGATAEENAAVGLYGVGHCAVVGVVTTPIGGAACGAAYVG